MAPNSSSEDSASFSTHTSRNPTPIQLAREPTPGLDILHPVEISLLQLCGTTLIAPLFTASMAGLAKCFRIDIPLVGQPGFDHLTEAVAIGRLDDTVFNLVEQAKCLDGCDHILARIEPVLPR